MPASVASDAVSYLLSVASDILDWFDDQEAETVRSIIELASELLDTITEGAEDRPSVSVAALLTAQAADHITDGADRFELHKTYDACEDQYNEAAVLLVDACARRPSTFCAPHAPHSARRPWTAARTASCIRRRTATSGR